MPGHTRCVIPTEPSASDAADRQLLRFDCTIAATADPANEVEECFENNEARESNLS